MPRCRGQAAGARLKPHARPPSRLSLLFLLRVLHAASHTSDTRQHFPKDRNSQQERRDASGVTGGVRKRPRPGTGPPPPPRPWEAPGPVRGHRLCDAGRGGPAAPGRQPDTGTSQVSGAPPLTRRRAPGASRAPLAPLTPPTARHVKAWPRQRRVPGG